MTDTDQAIAATTIRICRNLACLYVGNPDPREFRDAALRCPKCKTPWGQRPTYLGPEDQDGG